MTLLMMQVRSQPTTRNRSISAGNMEADVWGKTSDGGSAKAQESSVGAYDQVEWPELTAGTQGVERQVAPATCAGSSCVTTPPLYLADPPAAAGLEGGVAAQQITSEPSSRDSTPSVVAKLQTGMPQLEAMSDSLASVDRPGPVSLAGASARVSAPCPTDRAFSRKQRRRRRGRMTPSSPPVTVGKEGGVNSRGAQTLSEQRDAMNRAATVEAGSELRQTALEEDTAAATLPATLDRGSTVPVPYSDAVRPPNRQVLTGENMDTVARGRAGSGQGIVGNFRSALSQRREFQGKEDSGVGSAVSRDGLWVSTRRGQKGRQVVEGDVVAGQCAMSLTRTRYPRPGTREMSGAVSELMCMGLTGMVSARLPTAAARRYYGPASPAGRRGRRGQRRGNKKGSPAYTRLTGRSELAGGECAGSRAGPSTPLCPPHTRVRVKEAGQGSAAACLLVAGHRNGTECPSGTREPFTQKVAPQRSLLGMVERWRPHDVKPVSVAPDTQEDSLDEGAGLPAPVMDDDEKVSRTLLGVASGAEQVVGPSDLTTVQDSVESWFKSSEGRMPLEIRRADWSMMQDVGLGIYPDLAVAFAWRRSRESSVGGYVPLPSVHLVSREELDIPKKSWPNSWEGLVEHVERGGYFRWRGALRGGMDPAVAQQQLSLFDFNRHLDWDEIDRNLARVRAGGPISQDEMTENMMLAQLLSGCVALQQWDPLAAFLATQPPEVRAGLIISPARLAALAVIAARPKPEPESPPQWLMNASFAELRFNHLSPGDFVPDPHRADNLRGQILDGIVDRLLSVAPDMKTHPHFLLQNIRSDLRLELNLKDLQVDTCLFSAIAVLPTGPWISDFYKGTRSLGGRSFCTIVPIDLHIETELSNADQRVIRAIRTALGVDNAAFRLTLDDSLGKALRCDVRSRDDTVRCISTGGRGSRNTKEHVSPDSPDSRLLVNIDATGLLLARRTVIRMPLQLGPVTVSITLPQCPQHALKSALQPRDPAAIRHRAPGTMIDCPIVLVGPLPKGSLPAQTVHSGARMAELRRNMNEVCRAELQTKDVRLVGRYDKDRSPMFMYMEFDSAQAAQFFGSVVDHQVPPEFSKLMISLGGEKASQMQLWSCNLIAECLSAAEEKSLKALMAHGQARPCPLPPPASPPPPAPGHGAGPAVDGREAAASGQDNPANGQH